MIVKYLVSFFNAIFFVVGCSLVGTGIYLRFGKDDDYLVLCDKYSWATGANILLGSGAVILFVAFFGFIGTYKQSSCMLGIFFFLLLIIFVCVLGAGIFSSIKRGKLKCCGITGSSDYTGDVPKSCDGHRTTGCFNKIKDGIKSILAIDTGVGIGFSGFQIIGMVLSMKLIRQITWGRQQSLSTDCAVSFLKVV